MWYAYEDLSIFSQTLKKLIRRKLFYFYAFFA